MTKEGDRLVHEMNAQVYGLNYLPLTTAWGKLSSYMKEGNPMPSSWLPAAKGPGRPPLKEGPVKEGAPHGTPQGYRQNCRCLECRRANAERSRRYQEKRRRKQDESTAD